jgi:hypothetical protein
MSTWSRLLAALRREQQDVREAVDEAVVKGNAAMDRRERELHATPEEKLAMEQERAAENDAELEAIRRRIEGERP